MLETRGASQKKRLGPVQRIGTFRGIFFRAIGEKCPEAAKNAKKCPKVRGQKRRYRVAKKIGFNSLEFFSEHEL